MQEDGKGQAPNGYALEGLSYQEILQKPYDLVLGIPDDSDQSCTLGDALVVHYVSTEQPVPGELKDFLVKIHPREADSIGGSIDNWNNFQQEGHGKIMKELVYQPLLKALASTGINTYSGIKSFTIGQAALVLGYAMAADLNK